ncbi:hypothetical protein [Ekhidna sp.]
MKKLLMILGLIASVAIVAQTTSESKETSRTTSSSNSISSESSITHSSKSYMFDARFDKRKNSQLRAILIDRLGSDDLRKQGDIYEWSKESKGRIFFSCRLSDRRLNLNLNREVASDDFYDLIDELGDDLRDIVQSHTPHTWAPFTPEPPSQPQPPSNPNSTDPQLIDQELREAERELARAQRNVERLKKKKGNGN